MDNYPSPPNPDDAVEVPCSSTRPSSCSSSEGLGSRRGKRKSVTSQVTFADLFGSTEEADDFEDDSTEPDVDVSDSITLVRREPRRRGFPRMEHVLFLYSLASSLSRVNLKQVFRIKQCLTVLNLNVSQCEELFKLEDVKADDLKKASDLLIDARLGVEYAAGSILVFLLSQYLVKYGLKHAVIFCLMGSWLAHLLIYATIYLVEASTFYTFLAAIPLVISGGEILMSTLACTHIGTTSTGNARRWRFVYYHFCLLFPEVIAQLLDVYILPTMNHLSFELCAIGILSVAILLSLFFAESNAEGFESHSIKQRIRCSMGFVSFRETIMCFSRERPCRARVQVIVSIIILSTIPFYYDFFSGIQAAYMTNFFSWDSTSFVTASSIAVGASYFFCLIVNTALTRCIRPLDPSVLAIGLMCLSVGYLCLLNTLYAPILYYGALTMMAMPILGFSALCSHLCQLLERSEIAPVFGLICALMKVSHVTASRSGKLILILNQTKLSFLIVFACQVLYALFMLKGGLFMVIVTRNHGYPTPIYNPAISA